MSDVPLSLVANPRLSRWLGFAEPGVVELRTGKVEIGQGIGGALIQIAADELDIDPGRISLVAGDTATTPDEGWTSASISIEQGGAAVRHVCADVRRRFVEAAAAALGAKPEQMRVADGVFTAAGSNAGVDYWQLAPRVDLDRDYMPGASPKPDAHYRHVGRPRARPDLPVKLAGGGFIHDIVLPGMLHGRVVRPPRAGCTLLDLDRAAIETLPGVIALVVDGSFVGIVAAREEEAIAAASLAERHLVWSGGTPLFDLAARLRSLPAHRTEVSRSGAGAPAAGRVHRSSYSKPLIAHASIGLLCALADASDGLTVWTQSQGVFPLRANLARALGLAPEQVRVIHRPGAGCYGHNGADDVALDAALLARAIGRPVRVLWSRADELAQAPFGSAMAVDLEATLGDDGAVLDWRHEAWSATRLSRPGWGDGVNLLAASMLAHPHAPSATADPAQVPFGGGGSRNAIPLYDFPRHEVIYNLVDAAPLRTSALRSLGAFANVFAIESFIDELAAAAGVDPVAYRVRHMADPRAVDVIEAAAALAAWDPMAAGTGERGRGFGFAQYKNKAAWCAVVVEVELAERVRVRRVCAAVDAGLLIDPDGVRNQIEGGIIQAISWTLLEQVTVGTDGIGAVSWDSYPILGFADVPEIVVTLLDRPGEPSRGVGECAAGPVAAAIANAVHHAMGVRVRDLPLTPETLMRAIEEPN